MQLSNYRYDDTPTTSNLAFADVRMQLLPWAGTSAFWQASPSLKCTQHRAALLFPIDKTELPLQ
jgi:hypothetical protein